MYQTPHTVWQSKLIRHCRKIFTDVIIIAKVRLNTRTVHFFLCLCTHMILINKKHFPYTEFFLMEAHCFLCEVRTELLYIMWIISSHHCLQPIFTTMMSGHSLGSCRTVNSLLPPPVIINSEPSLHAMLLIILSSS